MLSAVPDICRTRPLPLGRRLVGDRVAVSEGGQQTYGTQIAGVSGGQPVPWPCTDPAHLDDLRASVGLEPFAVNAARYR